MFTPLKTATLALLTVLPVSVTLAQENLTSNTAGAGTAAGLTATALVEYATDRGVANIQLKDGQTGTNYIQALAEGKIDIANGPFILPFLLTRAAGPYASLGKEKGAEIGPNIQLLYPFTLSIFSMYAYDVKGIKGWDDLKGKKILNGPPRGAATTNSRALIQLFGGAKADTDYESVTVNWNQAASAVIDGTADVAVLPTAFPGPRVTQAGAAGAMTLYSMPKDAFESEAGQKLLNKPGSVAYTIPVADIRAAMGDGWTVVTEDDTFRGMAVTGGDFVNKSMDEETAYELAKSHIENIESHKKLAPFMASLNFGVLDPKVAGLCGPNPVKFHPGAVRAWEEAGHTIADCAKP
ncbi:C4-dicarboxylate ABC transporter substrate-binding protein [Chromatiales bacterium (ex Bugula neritina AB1)]|nr:C4-dicarboxylate ABC transporter substrate-binding protein [Chromatiales bacterium (ex Bugula neritina AB1)]